MITTGKTVVLLFTYTDGSRASVGSWVIPHDSDYSSIHKISSDLGWHLVYEMAKQPSKTVRSAEVVRWDDPRITELLTVEVS